MALISKQCRVFQPVSPAVTPRARACSRQVLCKAALQFTPQDATRRESLGLLLALPLLFSGQSAQAVDLGDFRKVKGMFARSHITLGIDNGLQRMSPDGSSFFPPCVALLCVDRISRQRTTTDDHLRVRACVSLLEIVLKNANPIVNVSA